MPRRIHLLRMPFVSIAALINLSCSEPEARSIGRDGRALHAQAADAATDSGYQFVYEDPLFKNMFIDVDEWRDEPVRHRYVHGGFSDTEARFSMYFPPEERYQGRFFQYVLPVQGNEHAVTTPEYPDPSYSIGFAVDSGAYLVETNAGSLGFTPPSDPDISMWRANAATAEHSRVLANQLYPSFGPHRPYGYAWGGSGGAFKTIACIESTHGVWDGVVPFVHASPIAMPNNFTVQAHAMRLLRGKLPGIIDALDPGGSGDPYRGLNELERAALQEVTRFGFPSEAWFNYESIAFGYTGVLASLIPAVIQLDGSYFDDFWKVPGYLGADHPEQLEPYKVHLQTTLTEVLLPEAVQARGLPLSLAATQPSNARAAAALKLAEFPAGDLQGASITFKSGAAAGSVVQIAGVFDDIAVIGYGQLVAGLDQLQPGDQVEIDNSTYLALQTYHRHTVPGPEYHVYDQYRDAQGKPLYPQRPIMTSSLFNQTGMMTGKFEGKMIVVEHLTDEIAFPWHADWYRARVAEQLGDRLDEQYRLWYVEKAMHTPPKSKADGLKPAITTRVTNYSPVLQQALRDVAAWAEQGVAPPASTAYEVVDGQVVVPQSARERRGIQPVVRLRADGEDLATVNVDQSVRFRAQIALPPGTGSIVGVEWDFDGSGDFAVKSALRDTSRRRITVEVQHAFAQPGTYFPAVRASAHREGRADTPYARIQNLGRARVVVK